MQIKYFAEDGTEFTSEKECVEYELEQENKLNDVCNGFYAADSMGNPITDICELASAYLVCIKDTKTLDLLNELDIIPSYYLPSSVGVWRYFEKLDIWENLYEYKARRQKEVDICDDFLKEVEERFG